MNLHDYLIDQEGKDWQSMLSAWAELLPATFTMWMVNRFGNVIVIVEDGSIHILDIHAATFEQVAASRAHFSDLADIPENADDWSMIPLVNQCVAAGIKFKPSQCGCFKIPPILGGNYSVDNIAAIDLAENYAFLADIWSQTKDLPNGTRVRLVVKKGGETALRRV